MKPFRIAVYPGDGIGQDVTHESIRVLNHAQELLGGFTLNYTEFPWGCDYYDRENVVAPPEFLEILKPFDAILLGAVGMPNRLPDHVTLAPLVQMRQAFDQYACVRPARLLEGVRSPLAKAGPIDMVIVRENSEGEYIPCGGRVKQGEPEELAIQSAVHTRRGIERILRFGFEMARTRRRRLTMITKSNALKYGMVLWDEVLDQVRGEYADVETDRQHADAAAMNFVRNPEYFDVVVASNLFGDILSDLAGAIVGGLGLAASTNINPERRFPSMFEPVHGSAPDIAGKGIANPIASILSAAMMLDWLNMNAAAAGIRSAVEKTLKAGLGTPDLGGTLSTSQLTDLILDYMREE